VSNTILINYTILIICPMTEQIPNKTLNTPHV